MLESLTSRCIRNGRISSVDCMTSPRFPRTAHLFTLKAIRNTVDTISPSNLQQILLRLSASRTRNCVPSLRPNTPRRNSTGPHSILRDSQTILGGHSIRRTSNTLLHIIASQSRHYVTNHMQVLSNDTSTPVPSRTRSYLFDIVIGE